MKKFNFTTAHHCPERNRWLLQNHNRVMSEIEFVHSWQGLRGFSKGSQNSPSRARQKYHYLKSEFGFFV